MTDEQFKNLIAKAKERSSKRPIIKSVPKKKISDAEFSLLIAKVKTYNPKDKTFKKTKVTSKKTIGLYEKVIGLYEKLIENENTPRTIIKKVEDKEINKQVKILEKKIEEAIRKINVYEQYNAQGGPGLVFHDASLSGSGVPGDPLKVVSSDGVSGFTYSNEIVSGSGTTFTLAHLPTNPSGLLLMGGGSVLIPGVGNDYTLSGQTITMTNSYSSGQVVAFYS